MRRYLSVLLATVTVLASLGPDLHAGASRQDPKLDPYRKQYDEALAKLKDDDEAGCERLAQWCRQNRLAKEADELYAKLVARKLDAVRKEPSADGYVKLAAWCSARNLKQAVEDVKGEALLHEYGQRKEKVAGDDAKGLAELARWCQQKAMAAQAMDAWQAVVKIEPDNAAAKTQIQSIRETLWVQAPTGLLKNQKVPGYSEPTAWFHISVPGEYKSDKTGLPLIVYLHGGHHNAGTADNIVALAQVLPTMKKSIALFPNHIRTWWANPKEMRYVMETLAHVLLKWRVDRKRIYMVGGSMGGNGAWAIGSQCSEIFAAVSPHAAWYRENMFPLKNLVEKPVYILHGTKDSTVPIGGARIAHAFLEKEGAKDLVFREVDCGHQPPNDEIDKAVEWCLKFTNKQEFDLAEIQERVSKIPLPDWLQQYEGK